MISLRLLLSMPLHPPFKPSAGSPPGVLYTRRSPLSALDIDFPSHWIQAFYPGCGSPLCFSVLFLVSAQKLFFL